MRTVRTESRARLLLLRPEERVYEHQSKTNVDRTAQGEPGTFAVLAWGPAARYPCQCTKATVLRVRLCFRARKRDPARSWTSRCHSGLTCFAASESAQLDSLLRKCDLSAGTRLVPRAMDGFPRLSFPLPRLRQTSRSLPHEQLSFAQNLNPAVEASLSALIPGAVFKTGCDLSGEWIQGAGEVTALSIHPATGADGRLFGTCTVRGVESANFASNRVFFSSGMRWVLQQWFGCDCRDQTAFYLALQAD